jgi:MFS family permease
VDRRLYQQHRHVDAGYGAVAADSQPDQQLGLSTGLDAFLAGIPIFLFSLVGGVIADRMDRRKVLLASQFVQMGSALLLTLLIALHVVQVWHVLCVSFITDWRKPSADRHIRR